MLPETSSKIFQMRDWLLSIVYNRASQPLCIADLSTCPLVARIPHCIGRCVSFSLAWLSRTPSDLLTRSRSIPRGWRNHTPRYHLICRRGRVALENGLLYEKSVNTDRWPPPETVNFSIVPCFALFTRVCVFPFVPLFNSPMDMLSVRHKDGQDYCRFRVKVFGGGSIVSVAQIFFRFM